MGTDDEHPVGRVRTRSIIAWLTPIVLLAAGNCGLCLFSLAAGEALFGVSLPPVIGIGGGLLLTLGLVLSALRDRRASAIAGQLNTSRRISGQLETALAQTRQAAATSMDEHLAGMMYELNFQDTERMSLYWIDVPGEQFIRFGRYCLNSVFRHGGALTIPLGQGVLGATLQFGHNGEHRVSFPPYRSRISWHANHATRGNLTNGVRVGTLRMPSVAYHCFAFPNPATGDYGAVLVVESTRATPWDLRKLRNVVDHRRASLMRSLLAIANARAHEPALASSGATL